MSAVRHAYKGRWAYRLGFVRVSSEGKVNTHHLSQHLPKAELPCSLHFSHPTLTAGPRHCAHGWQPQPAQDAVQLQLQSTLLLPGAAGQAFGNQQLLLTADQHKFNNKHSITTGQGLLLSCLPVSSFSFSGCGCRARHCPAVLGFHAAAFLHCCSVVSHFASHASLVILASLLLVAWGLCTTILFCFVLQLSLEDGLLLWPWTSNLCC
jgi:hypothetical protein